MAPDADQTTGEPALPSSGQRQRTSPASDQTAAAGPLGDEPAFADGGKGDGLPTVVDIAGPSGRDIRTPPAAAEGVLDAHPARPGANASRSSGAAGPGPAPASPPTLPPAENGGNDETPGLRTISTNPALGLALAAGSANTRRAYQSDWKQFASWCRRRGQPLIPPDPQMVASYLLAMASSATSGEKRSASTIERRLSALTWNYAQRGQPLDRKDSAIANAIAETRNTPFAPSRQKETLLAQDLAAMLETLDRGTLRGLRDRAMLLLGFAGDLRRSEIVGLDVIRDRSGDANGWIEFVDEGLLVTLRTRAGLREVAISRGSSDATCPVLALQTWLKFARITRGPLFRRVTGRGKAVGPDRLHAQEMARLVKRAALAAGLRGDLPERERAKLFGSQSLRSALVATNRANGGNQP